MSQGVEPSPLIEADLAKQVSDPEQPARPKRARSTYRRRFAVIYGILALILGVGFGALVVLLTKSDALPSPAWSAWEPDGSSNARVKQIADHVAKEYRFQGEQMVVALGGPPSVSAGGNEGTAPIPISAIAVRPDTSTGQAEEDDIDIYDASKSMQYVLCGLGEGCALSSGPPTEARHTLLRREALELALYTFKYVDGVESVTVFLPPPMGGQIPGSAVFLERGDIGAELSKPLSQTLSPITPSVGTIKAEELQTLNRITRARLYQFQYTQAQDLSAVLVLDPIVA